MRNLLLFLLMSSLSFTTGAADDCRSTLVKREIPLEVTPTYFIRVDTKAGKIFMSGDCVMSLDTGRCTSRGRTWEPYPISGSNLLTIPHCDNTQNICFYKTNSFVSQEASQPLFKDSGMAGYYQSIGFLEKQKDSSKVRILAYYGKYRDYNIRGDSITPASPTKKYCSNQDLKLPMISKDGKLISAWNEKLQKTVIYKLGESCANPIYQMDTMVGKMDFDYKTKYAAYHSAVVAGEDSENYLKFKQAISIVDLKSKQTIKISHGADFLYYPHFGENGLMYILKYNPKTTQYSLLEINPDEAMKNKKDIQLCTSEPVIENSTIEQ